MRKKTSALRLASLALHFSTSANRCRLEIDQLPSLLRKHAFRPALPAQRPSRKRSVAGLICGLSAEASNERR
jgi:hypothetical protein